MSELRPYQYLCFQFNQKIAFCFYFYYKRGERDLLKYIIINKWRKLQKWL